MNASIPITDILDFENWTTREGYMETTLFFNPLGEECLGDLNPYRFLEDDYTGEVIAEAPLSIAFEEWLNENLSDVIMTLERMGFRVTGEKVEA